jgi:hypothetical protein
METVNLLKNSTPSIPKYLVFDFCHTNFNYSSY